MSNFLVEKFRDGWSAIDIEYARYLRATTELSDIVRISREFTCKRVVGEGVHFDLVKDDEDADNNTIHTNKRTKSKQTGEGTDSVSLDDVFLPVRVEWNEFVENLDIEIMRQGFALITTSPSRHNPAILVPRIEDIYYYNLYHRYIPLQGIEYVATWTNLSQFQEIKLGAKNDDRITDAVLLVPVGSGPLIDGKLRSKLAYAAPLICEMEAMEENISYALYWGAHPVYVPQLAPTGPGTAKGNASAAIAKVAAPPYANYSQLLQDQSAVSRYARAQKLDDSEQVAEDALRRHLNNQIERRHEQITMFQRQVAHNNGRVANATDGNVRHAIHPPFSVDYPMEQGDTISSGPPPTLPAQIREHKNDLSRRAFLTLDVQPQLVTLEHSNHAANSEIAFAGQNDAIKNRQAVLEPLIAEAFRFVYNIDLMQVDKILSARKEDTTDATETKPLAKHSATPSTKSSAHRVRARLSNIPLTTFDALERMLKTHVIDHGTYREMVLQVASVSSHLSSCDVVESEQIDEWYGNIKPQKEESSSGSAKRKSSSGKSK